MKEFSIDGYVITGAPRSGKTFALRKLQQLGYHVFGEPVSRVIKSLNLDPSLRSTGKPPFGFPHTYTTKDYEDFLSKCWDLFLSDYQEAKGMDISFFDRGLPDLVSIYETLLNTRPPQDIIEAALNLHYNRNVFLFDLLPDDLLKQKLSERPFFSVDDCKRIKDRILRIYEGFGYELIIVPFADVDKRIQFVLDRI